MPIFFKGHDDCRRTVCVICMKKSDREISKYFISVIHCLISSDVNFQDERVPLRICVTCRCKLKKLGDGANALKAIQLYSFDSIVVKPLTRLTTCCDCIICQIAKVKDKEKHLFEKDLASKSLQEETTSCFICHCIERSISGQNN